MNEQAIRACREFLTALGLDLQKMDMERTPERVTALYETLFAGVGRDTRTVWGEVFSSGYTGTVMVRGLRFYSLCEHHLLPFFGTADIAYVPHEGQVAGLSKLEALVKLLSRRPQLQERLTEDIAAAIARDLGADGVWVRLQAEHLCMTMKGESAAGTRITTVAGRGTLVPGSEEEARILVRMGETDETKL